MTIDELNDYKDCARDNKQYGLLSRLIKQIKYQQGYADRVAGVGVLSSNGSYLEGYHDTRGPVCPLYYVGYSELVESKDRALANQTALHPLYH